MAVGVLDMALWDARAVGIPLYQLLADRAGRAQFQSVGLCSWKYCPGKDIVGLRDEFRQYLDLGYTVCKMKIRASISHDCDRIEAALKIVRRSMRRERPIGLEGCAFLRSGPQAIPIVLVRGGGRSVRF